MHSGMMKKHLVEFSLDGFQNSRGEPLGSVRGRSARAWLMLCLPVASSVTACLLILTAGQIVENWIGILGLGALSLLAFHLVFWSLRNVVSERSLKSSDYVFLAIVLLGLTFLLNVGEAMQRSGLAANLAPHAISGSKYARCDLAGHRGYDRQLTDNGFMETVERSAQAPGESESFQPFAVQIHRLPDTWTDREELRKSVWHPIDSSASDTLARQLMGVLLLAVGLALKATKVSAELLCWHTARTEQSTVVWG